LTVDGNNTRVLLVDDHSLVRAGVASLLRAWGFDVVGEAADGQSAVERARELQPELIFMDIAMPGRNGLEATRAIKAESPATKVVILTVSDDEQDLFEAMKAGAEGYLLKNLEEEQFADLVSRLGRGDPVISPGLARKLLTEFERLKEGGEAAPAEADLTGREREVLTEVARGFTGKEVAGALSISENTVNFHMKNIFSKLHLRNRAEVVAWAARHGYLPSPSAQDAS
jgi:DNA-binding NarL/FixJ family response regulator